MENEKKLWDNYWKKNLKFKILEFFRKYIISKEIWFYANSYLPEEGIILECGSGGGESSIYLKNSKRILIAVDISLSALKIAKEKNIYNYFIVSDISQLPFKNESISGLYNIGVMEHFPEEKLQIILKGFKEVLIPGGRAVIFWPFALAPFVLLHTIFTTLLLFPFFIFHKKFYNLLNEKIHSLFPEGNWLFFNPLKTRKLLKSAGFTKIKFKLSLFFLSHAVIYLEK
jgi:SAM-dependent methyltransferase